jgi:mono/diheme cytochrome c family protein
MKKLFIPFSIVLLSVCFLSFQKKQKFDLKASIARGQELYTVHCLACHQEKGEGIEDIYPPLAKSDYMMADKKRTIDQILHGVTGEIKVNGKIYNGEMSSFDLNDQEVSDVANYIRNSWGNKSTAVTPSEVAALRK